MSDAQHPPEISKNEERRADSEESIPVFPNTSAMIPTGMEKNTTQAHTVSIFAADSPIARVKASARPSLSFASQMVVICSSDQSFGKKNLETIPTKADGISTEI